MNKLNRIPSVRFLKSRVSFQVKNVPMDKCGTLLVRCAMRRMLAVMSMYRINCPPNMQVRKWFLGKDSLYVRIGALQRMAAQAGSMKEFLKITGKFVRLIESTQIKLDKFSMGALTKWHHKYYNLYVIHKGKRCCSEEFLNFCKVIVDAIETLQNDQRKESKLFL